ncbi:hypothetical protein F5Y07DRAFT_75425 [Xylaria sp. FL0933]|nr:hypothetical protein F5Y07DRAFT_75425 [Xylaria sp. FL0933]
MQEVQFDLLCRQVAGYYACGVVLVQTVPRPQAARLAYFISYAAMNTIRVVSLYDSLIYTHPSSPRHMLKTRNTQSLLSSSSYLSKSPTASPSSRRTQREAYGHPAAGLTSASPALAFHSHLFISPKFEALATWKPPSVEGVPGESGVGIAARICPNTLIPDTPRWLGNNSSNHNRHLFLLCSIINPLVDVLIQHWTVMTVQHPALLASSSTTSSF